MEGGGILAKSQTVATGEEQQISASLLIEPPSKRARFAAERETGDGAENAKVARVELDTSDLASIAIFSSDLKLLETAGDSCQPSLGGVNELVTGMVNIMLRHSRASLPYPVPSAEPADKQAKEVSREALQQATCAAKAVVDIGRRVDSFLLCGLCSDFLHQPTTIGCGHTFCGGCLDKLWKNTKQEPGLESSQVDAATGKAEQQTEIPCPALGCNARFKRPDYHVNSTLAILIQQWFPETSKRVECRWTAEKMLARGDIDGAVEKLTEGLTYTGSDYHLLCLRVHAYLKQLKLMASLEDANKCCHEHPNLAGSFVCRGTVFASCERHDDAVADYLYAVYLCGAANGDMRSRLSTSLSSVIIGLQQQKPFQVLAQSASQAVKSVVNRALALRCSTQTPKTVTSWNIIPASERKIEDIQCPICLRLYFQPITTPCGHTACRPCFDRLNDHRACCPCCRQDLASFRQYRHRGVVLALDRLLQGYAKSDYVRRELTHHAEIQEMVQGPGRVLKTPVFVCMLHFPTATRILRLFEPHYLLMFRRCMETEDKQFGMAFPKPEENTYIDCGTLVTIKKVVTADDGSKYVTVVGTRRFRVLDRDRQDGYDLARYEYWEDTVPETEEAKQSLGEFHDEVFQQAKTFFSTFPAAMASKVQRLLGTFPDGPSSTAEAVVSPDGPDWVWYCVHRLPFSEAAKIELLQSVSLRDRMHRIRERLNAMPTQRDKVGLLYYTMVKIQQGMA